MNRYGKDIDSQTYWAKRADDYTDALENDYHKHRLSMIKALIPQDLYAANRKIFDFGCGDGVHIQEFLHAGADIQGVDISPEMIEIAQQRLKSSGYDTECVKTGDVQALSTFQDQSLDAIISFNVLAYLSHEEEKLFYEQAARTSVKYPKSEDKCLRRFGQHRWLAAS